ncbi:MAG: hypothetical protein ABR991_04875 [Terracidiphilus sp.]
MNMTFLPSMHFFRRQQLQLVYRLSNRFEPIEKLLKVLFGICFVAWALIHTFGSNHPWLTVLATLNPEPILEAMITSCTVLTALLLVVYYIGIRLYLVHPNKRWHLILNRRDFKDRLINGPTQGELSQCQVEFVTNEKKIDSLLLLNQSAFNGSKWEMNPDDLRNRNLNYIKQNQLAFMLIKEPILRRRYIGYTCVLPLTPKGANQYQKKADSDTTTLLSGYFPKHSHNLLHTSMMPSIASGTI